MMRSRTHRFSLLAGALVVACGSSEAPEGARRAACAEAGESEPCACENGRPGEQLCRADGTLGPCTCGAGGSGAGTPGASGGSPEAGRAGAKSDGGDAGATPGDSGGATSGSSGAASSAGDAGADDAGTTSGGEAGAHDSATGGDAGDSGNTQAGAGHGGAGGVSSSDGGSSAGESTAGRGGSGVVVPVACDRDDIAGCRCPDNALGYRDCAGEVFRDCVCPPPGGIAGASGCAPVAETCNQTDDDCSGVADDHLACPDATVKNTSPFAGRVYVEGTLAVGSCGREAIQQFWPNASPDYLERFTCGIEQYLFRGQELYYSTGSALYRWGNGESATRLTTPSCLSLRGGGFGFDLAGALHYQCGDIVYRGEGEEVAGGIERIVAVLTDGRVVVTKPGWLSQSQYVVLSAEGEELVRFPPTGLYSGTLAPMPRAATIQGDRAYVMLGRSNAGALELLGYEIDADSTFRLMRRLSVPSSGRAQLLLSDGTIFIRDRDVGVDDLVTAHLPDNTSAVVWRSTESVLASSSQRGFAVTALEE